MSSPRQKSLFKCEGVNTLMSVLLCLLCVLSQAFSQADSSFTFPDFTPTIDVSLHKVFTTTVVVVFNNVTQGAFNQTIFTDTANTFYSTAFSGSILPVAISVNTSEIRTNTSTDISYRVNYDISYNYTQLITIAGTDSVIQTSIGSVSVVKNGFEAIPSFSDLYTLLNDPSNFTFGGNKLCSSVSCDSTYVFCNESDLGFSQVCRSSCFERTICQNGASCVQDSANRAPSCNCLGSGSIWYIGQYCEYKVEVWMIVVFLVLYLLVVAVILAIGCWCWKRAGKTRRKKILDMERRKSSPLMQKKANASQNSRLGRNSGSAIRNTRPGMDPLQEPLPQIPEENVVITSDIPPSMNSASDGQSEISRHSTTTVDATSESGAEILLPYETMHYHSRANDDEVVESAYQTLGSSGDKSTQANAQINLHLSDSVLARNVS